MIRKVYEALEGFIFDKTMVVAVPLLILWVNKGLRSEELSQEIRDFWELYNKEI